MTVGRDTRRMHVERFLASGMELEGWCMLNGIRKSSMYRWMRAFIEEEPEVFGGYDIAHAGDGSSRWLECILEARRRAFSIERAPAADVESVLKAVASLRTRS